jgi:hypothetical protein
MTSMSITKNSGSPILHTLYYKLALVGKSDARKNDEHGIANWGLLFPLWRNWSKPKMSSNEQRGQPTQWPPA